MRNLKTPILLISFLIGASAPSYAQDHTLRVALFVDKGCSPSEFKKELRNGDDITWRIVDGDDIRDGALKNFDALVVPGGAARKEAASMGNESREEVRRFVDAGGVYLGVCAGAYLASRARDTYLGLLPLKTLDQEHWYRVDDGTPLKVELTPVGMEVLGIRDSNVRIVYENGPVFAPPEGKPDSGLVPLGFFRSEVVADGGKRGVMLGAPAMIMSRYGRGMVLAISPHPEATPGLKEAEVHALHWLYDHRDARAPAANSNGPTRETTHSNSAKLSDEAIQLAQSIFDRANVVSYEHKEVPAARQVISKPDGTLVARTDCSGFISYIVNSIAPRHYEVVRSREPDWSYPQAEIWARFFDTLDNNQPYEGWLGIKNWRNLKPGDIIAWEKGTSAGRSNHNTGHIMLVMGKPSALQELKGVRFVEVPVIDSSTTYHFSPETLPPNAHLKHRNGLGKGTVRIVLSEEGVPIGYWAGTYWGEGQEDINGPTLSKMVRFARMMPNE